MTVIIPTRDGVNATMKNDMEVDGQLHAWGFVGIPYEQALVLMPTMSTSAGGGGSGGIPICPDVVITVPCECLYFCVPREGSC